MADESPARAVLQRRGLRPRKSLGQNFLRDRSYIARILEALDLRPEDAVLEIGPGTGVLTAGLAARAACVVAVELDRNLVDALREEFENVENLRVVEGDALAILPSDYFDGSYKLAGNIPYYITGPILRHYLEAVHPPEIMVLMLQREVAERVVAQPGTLSLLGVSAQFYSRPSIVARVPRRAFYPAPRVDSAIVKFVPREPPLPNEQSAQFFRLARAGFGTKRKTLRNALSHGLDVPPSEAALLLESAGIDGQRRAETLSVDDWVRLTRVFGPGEE